MAEKLSSPKINPRESTGRNTSPLLRSRTYSTSHKLSDSGEGEESSENRISGPKSILKGLSGSLILSDKRNSAKKIKKLNT